MLALDEADVVPEGFTEGMKTDTAMEARSILAGGRRSTLDRTARDVIDRHAPARRCATKRECPRRTSRSGAQLHVSSARQKLAKVRFENTLAARLTRPARSNLLRAVSTRCVFARSRTTRSQ